MPLIGIGVTSLGQNNGWGIEFGGATVFQKPRSSEIARSLGENCLCIP